MAKQSEEEKSFREARQLAAENARIELNYVIAGGTPPSMFYWKILVKWFIRWIDMVGPRLIKEMLEEAFK